MSMQLVEIHAMLVQSLRNDVTDTKGLIAAFEEGKIAAVEEEMEEQKLRLAQTLALLHSVDPASSV